MSRGAYWDPTAAVVANPGLNGAVPQTVPAAPTGAPVAPGATIPVRSAAGSALAAQVKLERLADVLSEAAGIVRELAQVQLAAVRETRDITSVERPTRLLTVDDLAERFQVDARTIRRWRKHGKIPTGIEISGVIRWRPEEIEGWLAK